MDGLSSRWRGDWRLMAQFPHILLKAAIARARILVNSTVSVLFRDESGNALLFRTVLCTQGTYRCRPCGRCGGNLDRYEDPNLRVAWTGAKNMYV